MTNIVENDSQTVRAGSKTYFFDLKGTEEGQPYLVVTESRLVGEGQDRERTRIVVFPDHALDFLATTQTFIFRLLTDGQKFEDCLTALFQNLGYEVTTTRHTGDYGGDLIIEKSGTKTLVQAKRSAGKVGVKAIQEAVAAKAVYHCQRAMVVTNSFFTKPAFELDRANHVTLWHRKRFLKALQYVKNLDRPNGRRKKPPVFLADG